MIKMSCPMPNGATAEFHVIAKTSSAYPHQFVMVDMNSYASEDDYINDVPSLWGHPWKVPASGIAGDLLGHIERWMIGIDGPLSGGSIVADSTDTLESAQSRAWEAVKLARANAENAPFPYGGGMYDADKARITGAVVAALLNQLRGTPYTEDWTLSDDSVRTLTGAQVMEMGVALADHVAQIHAAGRTLRARIEAATTIDEALSVTWSTLP